MTGFSLFVLLLEFLSVAISALPDGFIVETVTSEAMGTTGLFAPHPAGGTKPPILLVVEKRGQVSVVENPDDSPDARIILDLSNNLCTDGERGLQSIAIHPNFAENRFVYLFYAEYIEGCPDSITEGTWNTVSRFVMDPETLEFDYESREHIWRSSRLRYNIHNGGAMDFGNDGKLYITTGDSGRKSLAQPLDNTLGSIIRLNDDGTVPLDNPYTIANGYEAYRCADTDGRVPVNSEYAVCSEVFAHGFRNPFRMKMDPMETEKVKFSISEVGGSYWEELNIGGTDYPGRNYGWPNWEGPCRESSATNCPVPSSISAMEPYHYYEHRSIREGAAIAGSAFVPPGIWPSKYKFLFIDFIFLEIYNLIEAPGQECRTCMPPISGYRNETFLKSIQKENEHVNNARMLDMFFGPYKDTQALYVIRFGDHDTVLRIRYNDIINNAPPIADFQVPQLNFAVDTDVKFDGSISSDPDGDALKFLWDFGDGNFSNETSPTHLFKDLGEYDVTLKVTDTCGQMQQKTETVIVGIPPAVTILSPAEGDRFFVGELLTLQGEAFDHTGARLDDIHLTWEVRKHHADHFHPFMDLTTGNDLTLYPAPEPEDYFATTNSYLRIILSATDKDGLTSEIDRVVQPSLVVVELVSTPRWMKIMVDDEPVITSETVISWHEHDLRLEVKNQELYKFKSWADGNTARERKFKLSKHNGVQLIQANFCKMNENSCLEGDECCSESCVMNVCRPVTQNPTKAPTTDAPSYAPSVHLSKTVPETDAPSIGAKLSPTSYPSLTLSKSPTSKPTIPLAIKGPSIAPAFQEPSLNSLSEMSSFNFIASVILSFVNAVFVLIVLPYIILKKVQNRKTKRTDVTDKSSFQKNESQIDESSFQKNESQIDEQLENSPFDDCSFNAMNLTMMNGDFDYDSNEGSQLNFSRI